MNLQRQRDEFEQQRGWTLPEGERPAQEQLPDPEAEYDSYEFEAPDIEDPQVFRMFNWAHKIYGFWDEPIKDYEGETFNHSEILESSGNLADWRSHHRRLKPIVDTIFEVIREEGFDEIKDFNDDFDPKGYPEAFFVHLLNYLDKDEIKDVTRAIKRASTAGGKLSVDEIISHLKPQEEKYQKDLPFDARKRIEYAQEKMEEINAQEKLLAEAEANPNAITLYEKAQEALGYKNER